MIFGTERPRGEADVVATQLANKLYDKLVEKLKIPRRIDAKDYQKFLRYIARRASLYPVTSKRLVKPETVITLIIRCLSENPVKEEMFIDVKAVFPYVMDTIPHWYQFYSGKRQSTDDDLADALKEVINSGELKPLIQAMTNMAIPIPGAVLSEEEVEAKREAYAKRIFDSYETLQKCLSMDGIHLVRKWRSTNRRVGCLKKAWEKTNQDDGTMNMGHRMDIIALTKGFLELKEDEDKEKIGNPTVYKWPYINLVDLEMEPNFLIFAFARARNPPFKFVHMDANSWKIGYEIGEVPFEFTGQLMKFWDRTEYKKYGELEIKDIDKKDNQTLPPLWGDLPVAKGLITMQLQAHIYEFLVNCCMDALSATPEKYRKRETPDGDVNIPPPLEEVIIQAYEKDKSTRKEGEDQLHEILSIKSQYGYPELDVDDLINGYVKPNIRNATRNAYELMEQPSCFYDVLQTALEHHNSNINDKDGTAPCLPSKDHVQLETIAKVITRALFERVRWDYIRERITLFKDQIKGHEANKKQAAGLLNPKDEVYLNCVQTIIMLESFLHLTLTSLGDEAMGSPEFRDLFWRDVADKPKINKRSFTSPRHMATKETRGIKGFFISVLHAVQKWRIRETIGMVPFAYHLEHLLKEENDLPNMPDPYIGERIQLGVELAYCISQLYEWKPYSSNFKYWRERAEREYQAKEATLDVYKDRDTINALEAECEKVLIEQSHDWSEAAKHLAPKIESVYEAYQTKDEKEKAAKEEKDYVDSLSPRKLSEFWKMIFDILQAEDIDIINRLPSSSEGLKGYIERYMKAGYKEPPRPLPRAGEKRPLEDEEEEYSRPRRRRRTGLSGNSVSDCNKEGEVSTGPMFFLSKKNLNVWQMLYSEPGTPIVTFTWYRYEKAIAAMGFRIEHGNGSQRTFYCPPHLVNRLVTNWRPSGHEVHGGSKSKLDDRMIRNFRRMWKRGMDFRLEEFGEKKNVGTDSDDE